jgi:hypothetical protein
MEQEAAGLHHRRSNDDGSAVSNGGATFCKRSGSEPTKIDYHEALNYLKSCANCCRKSVDGKKRCNIDHRTQQKHLNVTTTVSTIAALGTTFAAEFVGSVSTQIGLSLAATSSGAAAFLFSTASSNKQHKLGQMKTDLVGMGMKWVRWRRRGSE